MFKRIRRTQADGSVVIVEVPGNYILQNGEELVTEAPTPIAGVNPVNPQQQPPQQSAAEGLTAETVQRMIAEARQAERAQLQQQLDADRQARETLQAQITQLESERQAAAVNAMTPDARRDHEFQQLRTTMEQSQQQYAQQLQALQNQLLQADLQGYREHLLRVYGDAIFPEMVVGNSRQALDAAAANSHNMFNQARARFEADMMRRFGGVAQGAPVPQLPPAVGGQLPQHNPNVPTITVPQSPHFIPPQGYGFPAPVAPGAFVQQAVTESNPDISAMTSEEAVRNGSYAQNRQAILEGIREGGNPNGMSLGTAPRYAMGTQHLPNGVTAPVAAPMAPASNSPQVAAAYPQAPAPAPQYAPQPAYPQVQYAPPAPPPGAAPVFAPQPPPQQQYADPNAAMHAAALESIRRTREGNNQVAGALPPDMQNRLRAATADMRNTSQVDPRAVYAQTFQHTAPIPAGAPN